MTNEPLTDFLILRELDESISRDELEAAARQSGEVLSSLREEGVDIHWEDSEVLTNEDGGIVGTFCHYRARDKNAVYEHADRAGLPATLVREQGEPLSGE